MTLGAETGRPAFQRGSLRAITHSAAVRAGVAGAFAAAVVAGCGSGAPALRTSSRAQGGQPVANIALPLGASVHTVSLGTVQDAIASVYRRHPGISSFVVQDVAYTPQSRAKVLRTCSGASFPQPSSVESSRLLACAPLIFFLYSYGHTRSVPQAVHAADALYSYASTTINGPVDARATLAGILHGWGVPVAPAPSRSRPAATNPAAGVLVDAARKAILSRRSVHVVIAGGGATRSLTERVVADISRTSAVESISNGPAHAAITVTPTVAYISGNRSGLRMLIGLPASAAARAGRRWIAIKAGTREYQDLTSEDTIASLPASILPATNTSLTMRAAGRAHDARYRLSWASPVSAGSGQVAATLELSAGAQPLPVRETTQTGTNRQTVTFSHWDRRVTIPHPGSVVSFTTLTR